MIDIGKYTVDINIAKNQPLKDRYYWETFIKGNRKIKVHHYFGIERRDYNDVKTYWIYLWSILISIGIKLK